MNKTTCKEGNSERGLIAAGWLLTSSPPRSQGSEGIEAWSPVVGWRTTSNLELELELEPHSYQQCTSSESQFSCYSTVTCNLCEIRFLAHNEEKASALLLCFSITPTPCHRNRIETYRIGVLAKCLQLRLYSNTWGTLPTPVIDASPYGHVQGFLCQPALQGDNGNDQ